MAKRMRTGGRGISTHHHLTANRTVARPAGPVHTVFYSPPHNSLTDRRLFTADYSIRPLAAVNRNATRIVAVDKFGESIRRQTKAPLRFAAPEKISLCQKRKARKEVLHAKGKAGGRVRKPTRNFWSSISCNR